jgi:probable HAF family extracellular repeat protein
VGRLSWLALITFGIAAASADPAHAAPFTFLGLGELPGGAFASQAYDVSGDGSVVVGRATSASGSEAFRWTSSGGMVGLGDFIGGAFDSSALGISDNGSVIVGYGTTDGAIRAFYWYGSGLFALGGPIGFGDSAAHATNGGLVAGSVDSAAGRQSINWVPTLGESLMGDLPGGAFNSTVYAMGGNQVLVGQATSASGIEAFRWTTADGMVGLGDFAGGAFESEALGISADGNVIVGYGTTAAGTEAFRWTTGGGMAGLGDLPGGGFASAAFDTSADGSLIVGRGATASGSEAFLWTESLGMVSLKDYLLDANATGLAGWTLRNAYAVSADGSTIVGYGTNPDGFDEAFIATIPEPSTLLLAACGGLCMLAVFLRRWRVTWHKA